eukprot:Colp12_sorted_trinity150504_noHs@27273
MVNFKVEATIPMKASTYWVERETEEFRRIQCEVLKLKALDIVEEWMEGTQRCVRLRTAPQLNIPSYIIKALGASEIVFDDIITYPSNAPPYRLEFTTIPSVCASYAKISGTITLEEIDEHTCRQVLEGTCEVKVWGVGGKIEQLIIDNLHHNYSLLPEAAQRRQREIDTENISSPCAKRSESSLRLEVATVVA